MAGIKAFTKTALIFRKYLIKAGIHLLVYASFIDFGNILRSTNESVI